MNVFHLILFLAIILINQNCSSVSQVIEENNNLCFHSYERDVLNTREIQGTWIKHSTYKHPGVFPFQKDMQEWSGQACPVQSRVFSCRRNDENETFGHGYDTFSQKFVPSNCQLNEFEPLKFLSMIQNRRLGIAGDSVSMQFMIMIVCSLHGVTPNIQYNLSWEDLARVYGRDVCVPGGEHCHLDQSTVYYPEFNATILYLPEFYHVQNKEFRRLTLKEYIDLGSLYSSKDILLLNIGLHVHQQEDYYRLISSIAEEYTHLMNETGIPIFFWRETSPQHFPGSGAAGYYEGSSAIKSPCMFYSDQTEAYNEDWRNRLAGIYLHRVHVPILSIANATGLAADQHLGNRQDGNRNKLDCTHFCESSGVYYYWREILFNILPLVTAAWENGEAVWVPPAKTLKKKFNIGEGA